MKGTIRLYFFGVGLGIFSILKLRKINKRILEMIYLPMNYWRSIETPLILDSLNPKEGETILDIGSPKLLSFYLSKKFNVKVIASDVNDYFIDYCNDFSKVLDFNGSYETKILDATRLNIKSNSIDKVYALSVFEHIPKEGDITAMKEVRRVLKKGGIFLLTIPYGNKFQNEFRNKKRFYYSNNSNLGKNDNVFYQRRYDEVNIYKRIINPSGMKLIKIKYVGEKSKLLSKFSLNLFSFLNLFLSKINHSVPSEELNKIKNLSMVFLVFRK